MLRLQRWMPEKGGAMLVDSEGQLRFRTLDQLETLIPFSYTSPLGADHDLLIFMERAEIPAHRSLGVAV